MKTLKAKHHKFLILFLILPLLCAFSFGPKDAKEEDHALFPSPDAFTRWDVSINKETAKETIAREEFPDTSLNIYYSFKTGEDSEDFLNIESVVGYEISPLHAKMSYIGETAGFAFSTLGAISIKTINNVKTYGDESSLSLLVSENGPFGNLFLTRKKNKTYLLTITGIYIDDPELWDDFITPYMTYFETYIPQKNAKEKKQQ